MLPTLLACAFASPYAVEADRITEKTIATFYDRKAKIWKPPVASAESVDRQGYTFWPSLLAWQAVIEGAKVDPKRWKPRIRPYYDALEQYFDRAGHAYCAWRYFPGNDDKFYDDNTWAAVACMEAYEVTGDARYRARAIDIFEGFVKGGWDASDNPGGLRWGTKAGLADRSDRTVSATAAGALAALLIAKTHAPGPNRQWAKRSLDWIRTKLSAPNGLIYDGFRSPNFERMNTIWTYNTGVPIRAAVEYSRQTKDVSYRKWAIRMGDACLDRTQSPMFDGGVTDLSKRYWYDGIYFVQYLVDGMRSLSLATGDRRYLAEARREADYCRTYLLDADGLYWRNMRLWTIDRERDAAFRKLTGQKDQPPFTPDGSERSMDPAEAAKPVEDRATVKTLLANAGAARMFWLLAH
jgi:predicted alpha-1,6-mannanase (GH76 family)